MQNISGVELAGYQLDLMKAQETTTSAEFIESLRQMALRNAGMLEVVGKDDEDFWLLASTTLHTYAMMLEFYGHRQSAEDLKNTVIKVGKLLGFKTVDDVE